MFEDLAVMATRGLIGAGHIGSQVAANPEWPMGSFLVPHQEIALRYPRWISIEMANDCVRFSQIGQRERIVDVVGISSPSGGSHRPLIPIDGSIFSAADWSSPATEVRPLFAN
jgi:hypothetical protein